MSCKYSIPFLSLKTFAETWSASKKFSISIGCILVAPLRYKPLIAINIERSNLVGKSVKTKEYLSISLNNCGRFIRQPSIC